MARFVMIRQFFGCEVTNFGASKQQFPQLFI
jgi:hypothetical protein